MSGILRSWGSHEGGNIVSSAARPLAAVTLSFAQLLNAAAQETGTEKKELSPHETALHIAPNLDGDTFMLRQQTMNKLTEILSTSQNPQDLYQSIVEAANRHQGGKTSAELRSRLGHLRDSLPKPLPGAPSFMSIQSGSGREICADLEKKVGWRIRFADENVEKSVASARFDLGKDLPTTSKGLAALCNSAKCMPVLTANEITLYPLPSDATVHATDRLIVVHKDVLVETEDETKKERECSIFHMPDSGATLTFPVGEDSKGVTGPLPIRIADGRLSNWGSGVEVRNCSLILKQSTDPGAVNVMTGTVPQSDFLPLKGGFITLGPQKFSVYDVRKGEEDGTEEIVVNSAFDFSESSATTTYMWQLAAATRFEAYDASGTPLETIVRVLNRQEAGVIIGLTVRGKTKRLRATALTRVQQEDLRLP